jgi:hypothetical protein
MAGVGEMIATGAGQTAGGIASQGASAFIDWLSDVDPNDPEFRRYQQQFAEMYGVPKFGDDLQRSQAETYNALGASRGVGAQQAALANALRAQAEGRGPSLAQMQYNQALGQTQAAIQSQLASARGLSPAQAQRIAARQQAAMGAGAASQSAMLRLQEQQAAQAALGNLLGQQRQQELLGGQLASGMYGTAAQGSLEASKLQVRAGEDARRNLAHGAEIKGQAKFQGDTRSNDTVPAMLSPGEIVLPRTVAQPEDAPEKAKKFVEAIKKQKRPSPKAYAQALARLQELESRMDAMEALADLEAEQEG